MSDAERAALRRVHDLVSTPDQNLPEVVRAAVERVLQDKDGRLVKVMLAALSPLASLKDASLMTAEQRAASLDAMEAALSNPDCTLAALIR